ncbi:hypothetical protein [Halomarina oriensis]|uniref:Uncharacterized protein n=1 Tax=Halomarina oriensis TaxID=671145 RepID=A0A6B0GP03_9EURY|nr:hypothetical protein [Halomarina oriensis]MWG36542.1 hypothetical protein [Halomarina oriensis]
MAATRRTPRITDHSVLRYRMRVDPLATRHDVEAALAAATDPVPASLDHSEPDEVVRWNAAKQVGFAIAVEDAVCKTILLDFGGEGQ